MISMFYPSSIENKNQLTLEFDSITQNVMDWNDYDMVLQNNSCQRKYFKRFECIDKQEQENIQQKDILIIFTQFSDHLILTSELFIFKKFQQNYNIFREKIFLLNNLFRLKGYNYFIKIEGDKVFIQFKCIFWHMTKNLKPQQFKEQFKREIDNLLQSIQDAKLVDYQAELLKIMNIKSWIKDIIQKSNCLNPLHITQKKSNVNFQNFFLFINPLNNQENSITYFCHNENNLYNIKYAQKKPIQLDEKQVFSLNQLQQQINGFIAYLPEKKQKIIIKLFIRIGFDLANKQCYLFATIGQPLKVAISSEDFAKLPLKKQKKLIDSLSIIYSFQQQQFLKEDYLNEKVYYVNNKGKLQINILNSAAINKSKENEQKQNTNNFSKTDQLIQLIEQIVQINLIKNLELKEDKENLLKLQELTQYCRQETIKIQQLISVLDQIEFKQKKIKK